MSGILRIRGEDGKFKDILAIKGASAYEQAVLGGFVGTEADFIQILNENLDGFDGGHIADKNNPHGVTAEQTGALPLSGGQVKGEIQANAFKQNASYYNLPMEVGRFIDMHKVGSTSDYDLRLLVTDDDKLQIVIPNKGYFSIYGEHNKPTPNDVGALSETIYIEEKDVLSIADDGWYYGIRMTNVPSDVNAGYVRVMCFNSNHRVVYWRPHNSRKEYVNVLTGGAWLGWNEVVTDAYGFYDGNNKPSGTYTGTGGSLTVNAGGSGNFIILHGTNGYFGLASKYGARGFAASIAAISASEARFVDGTLIFTTNSVLNKEDVVYTYQVL